MNFNEIKKTWSEQKSDAFTPTTENEIMTLIRNKMQTHDEKVTSRDRLEISVAAVISVACGVYLFFADSIWHQLGCVVTILSCIVITYRLISAKQISSDNQLQPDISVKAHLRAELQKVQNQKNLLKSVLWWYLLPLFLSIVLFVMGFDISSTMKAVVIIVNAIVYGYIWKMNQKAVSEHISPLIKEIEESLDTVDASKS